MKKYTSRSEEREERKRRRIQIAVSLFLVFLMVFSTVAFYFQPDPTKVRYGDYTFRAQVDSQGFIQGYTTKIAGEERSFYTLPDQSLDIALPEGFAATLQNAPLVVVLFNPEDNLTALYDQVRFDFANAFSQPLVPGITQESSSYPFSVLDCANASPDVPFILLAEGARGITQENGCYVVRGAQYDYAFLRDRIVYRYYNITES